MSHCDSMIRTVSIASSFVSPPAMNSSSVSRMPTAQSLPVRLRISLMISQVRRSRFSSEPPYSSVRLL